MMGIFQTWQLPNQAAIFSLEEAARYAEDIRKGNPRSHIALTSGGFDPIHPGHISCIQRSRWAVANTFGEKAQIGAYLNTVLIVVVNGEEFLKRKKGRAFMPLKVRSQIVSALREVSIVVPFNPSALGDMSVCEPLRVIQPDFFTKGGDRDVSNIPEAAVCEEHNIRIVTGVGDDKYWSSSEFLKEHEAWIRRKVKKYG